MAKSTLSTEDYENMKADLEKAKYARDVISEYLNREISKTSKKTLSDALTYFNNSIACMETDLKFFNSKKYDNINLDNPHTVIETLQLPDGTWKDFKWKTDDWNSIGTYWEDRELPKCLFKRIIIDGKEVTFEEADKIILEWEEKLRPLYSHNQNLQSDMKEKSDKKPVSNKDSIGYKIYYKDSKSSVWQDYMENMKPFRVCTFDDAINRAKNLFIKGYKVKIVEVYETTLTIAIFGSDEVSLSK